MNYVEVKCNIDCLIADKDAFLSWPMRELWMWGQVKIPTKKIISRWFSALIIVKKFYFHEDIQWIWPGAKLKCVFLLKYITATSAKWLHAQHQNSPNFNNEIWYRFTSSAGVRAHLPFQLLANFVKLLDFTTLHFLFTENHLWSFSICVMIDDKI